MSDEEMRIDGRTEVAGLPDEIKNAPISMAHGLSGIALTMAMKYHDISTVQDGTMYQQFKLEGRNMVGLELAHVFETAERIEEWLVGSEGRIAKILIAVLENADIVPEEDVPDGDGPTPATDGAVGSDAP